MGETGQQPGSMGTGSTGGTEESGSMGTGSTGGTEESGQGSTWGNQNQGEDARQPGSGGD
jgi:hypothetical protein